MAVSSIGDEVGTLLWSELVEGPCDGLDKCLEGPCGLLAQVRLQLGDGLLDRVEVWRALSCLDVAR
jgi:hypothetical protein